MSPRRAPLAEAAAVAATASGALGLPGGDELLTNLADAARAAFGAAACSIAVLNDDARELVYRAAAGAGAAETIGMRLALGRGLAGFAVSSGETLAVEDVSADARFDVEVARRTGYVPRSILVAPIAVGDDTVGVISILDRTTRSGTDALDLAARFARVAAGVLQIDDAVGGVGRIVFEAAARATEAARPDVAATLRALAEERRDDDLALVLSMVARARRLGDAERAAVERILDGALTLAARRTRR